MKKLFIVCFFAMVVCTPCMAKDVIVEFIEENYKEIQTQFSNHLKIYHSIQVNSSMGPKILILTGEDYHYRKWLRHYIAENKEFIAKISEDRIEEFITAKAYEVDVTSLHPFNGKRWIPDIQRSQPESLQGDNHILIVDPNEKRTELIQIITDTMGYDAVIFKTGSQALDLFHSQPEKFQLIMVHHSLNGMSLEKFIEMVLASDDKVPVMIDTGYKNHALKNKVISKYSKFKSVHIQPVLLKNLQKNIAVLSRKNV